MITGERIPLNRIVGIAGVSGSGKSYLAQGILYVEGAGGSIHGGKIIVKGKPKEICNDRNSLTGKYLKL